MNNINVLLEEVKQYLNYTWEDSVRDTKLVGYINSSIAYLEEVADARINLSTDFLARDLFFNRVLYMNSQALDDFNNNYSGMLNELKIKYRHAE